MLNAVLATLLMPSALAGDIPERPFPDVLSGPTTSQVDWTRLELQVTARSDKSFGAWKDRKMQEQDALDSLGPRVRDLATGLLITPDHGVQDILDGEPRLANRLETGLQSWKVSETRYHTGEAVEMSHGSTSTHGAAAWPASRRRSRHEEPGDATGVVIDTNHRSRFMVPRVQTAEGRVLIDLSLIRQRSSRSRLPSDTSPIRRTRAHGKERAILPLRATMTRAAGRGYSPRARRWHRTRDSHRWWPRDAS